MLNTLRPDGEDSSGGPPRVDFRHEAPSLLEPDVIRDTEQEIPPKVQQRGEFDYAKGPLQPFTQWMTSDAYGAPRVFDLYTLLAVIVAFAIMFGALKLIEPLLDSSLPAVAAGASIFVTGIAIAQLAMWGGRLPRLASIVAGPALWIILHLGFAVGFGALRGSFEAVFLLIVAVVTSSPVGMFFGYLGGAVVAGVFLIAEAFRNRLQSSDSTGASSTVIRFDDVE